MSQAEAEDQREFLSRPVHPKLPIFQRVSCLAPIVGLAFQPNGRMFWFMRKKFFGSYFVFSCRRRG